MVLGMPGFGNFSLSLSSCLDTSNSENAFLIAGDPFRSKPLGIFPSEEFYLSLINISLLAL